MTRGVPLRVLYISYDGALEPLGHSQILPYLRGLRARGAEITVLSFEKSAAWKSPERMTSLRLELAAAGIRWIPLKYHKRPMLIATALDVLVGTVRAYGIVRRQGIRVVHARSYVAALIAWLLKRCVGVPFIFDMRGFWADERVEGRLWSRSSVLYRLTKRLERRFLQDADQVITLTERARRTIEEWFDGACPPMTVIPTCVDLERFAAVPTSRVSHHRGPVFVYAGSVGTWYLLPEMLRFTKQARHRFPDARMLILTRQISEASRNLQEAGLASPVVELASVDPSAVPGLMAQAHAGLAFYQPGFSRQGTCPTKIGEYLAAGLPVMVNSGIGDTEQMIRAGRVGIVVSEFSHEEFDRALNALEQLWADPELHTRCRQVAKATCSLERGIERYWAIYERVAVVPVSQSADACSVARPLSATQRIG